MNAKELAGSISRFVGQIKPTNNPSDDAVIKGFPEWFIEDLENSATMLRQQADRIAELEKVIFDRNVDLAKTINRIAELEDKLSMYEIKDLDK